MDKLLFVIDMQNDFIDGSLGTDEAKNILPNVIHKVQSWDGYAIATLDTHNLDYLDTTEGKSLPIEHCIIGTTGWELPKALDIAIKEIGKKTYQYETFETKKTFGDHNIFNKLITGKIISPLSFKNIKEIHFCGLCTDICVISNVLIAKSFFPDTRIIVDASCCAGTSPENHEAALRIMKSCQIEIVNS